MNNTVLQKERDLVFKLKALKAVIITIDQLSRNYPIEGVEQEVFTRVKHYLEIMHGIYTQE